ncbi:MFS transporter [Subtercola lobariae]|uniref:MFS transporter n=1 Tax=Subtercola lobariae TaxID=1588641 RepID=A0A917BF54_9MICO|nr:MFS transporter [Subtercola lobariae]GGF37755.1 MFS transporter [Subtercola lobariae]
MTAIHSAAHSGRAVAVASVTQLIVVLDGAVLTIALPSLAADLNVPVASLPWVANAYALAVAGSLLLGGRIADLFGAVPCLRFGLGLFALASLGAGLSPTFGWLLFFRVMQGFGAALLSPAGLALLTDSTSPGHDRERAIATWSVTATVGGTVGALVGGTLTQVLDWRWTLLINVAIAPVLLLMTRNIGRRRQVSEERLRRAHFDIPGSFLFLVGISCVTLAVTSSVEIQIRLAGAVVALLALGVFVLVERRSEHPILPLAIVFTKRVGITNGAAILLIAGLSVMGFYTSLYAQIVTGLSPVQTALWLLPSAVAGAVTSKLVPRVITRLGEKSVRTAAPLVAAIALALLAVVALFEPPFYVMVPLIVLEAVGASTAVVVLTAASTRSLPPHRAGLAGGLITTSGQVGSSVGLALITGIAAAAIGGGNTSLTAVNPSALAGQMAIALGLGALITACASYFARRIPLGHAFH